MIKYLLTSLAGFLVNPYSFTSLLIISFMFYRQNLKTTLLQKMVIGKSKNSPIELTASQIVLGIFAAAIASFILASLGITFDGNSNIDLIFIVSLFLVIINSRFICFSYSGALLGLLSIIFEKLAVVLNKPYLNFINIDIFSLMCTISVLHFIEGILVMFDGKRGAVPVFSTKKGKIVGGFLLKRRYVLPMTFLFIYNANSFGYGTDYFLMNGAALTALTVFGIIGYDSVTFTKTKEKKAFSSGVAIIIYSLLLFCVSQISRNNSALQIFLLIFAPGAHEIMILLQKYFEIKGKNLYVSSDEGMMVLDVEPYSPAYEMGIKSGDLITKINNKKIQSEKDILEAVGEASNFIFLKAKKLSGEFREIEYDKFIDKSRLGLVLVPKSIGGNVELIPYKNNFDKVLNNIKNKHNRK